MKKKTFIKRKNFHLDTGKRNKLKQNIFTITFFFYFEESNKRR